ncbi:hypothetical protein [Micromonospora sediminicola]|uniref:hypothetical protein n=1 Tax=Micromonospora sediminicola TaxID=946078 RepID=UPI00378E88F7
MPHLVRLRPGADRTTVLANLRTVRNNLVMAQGHGDLGTLLMAYQQWAHGSVRQLSSPDR